MADMLRSCVFFYKDVGLPPDSRPIRRLVHPNCKDTPSSSAQDIRKLRERLIDFAVKRRAI